MADKKELREQNQTCFCGTVTKPKTGIHSVTNESGLLVLRCKVLGCPHNKSVIGRVA